MAYKKEGVWVYPEGGLSAYLFPNPAKGEAVLRVVEEVRGDALPQEALGGLALEGVAEEVEGGGDEAQGVPASPLWGTP